MARHLLTILMSASALTCVSQAAHAQVARADEMATLEEVVVTARRADENIQDVPVTVQAISGEALERNAVTNFTEVNKLAPGLQLSFASGSRGSNAEVTLRGVRWSSASGAVAIPIYINEVDVDPNIALLTLYDVGQLEVLRGPQGTARGAPSISGAVTVRTRGVNLNEYGGYASALVGTLDHTNFQGAVNIPIIQDKLGVRIAGMKDENEGNRVRSLNNRLDPNIAVKAGRITVEAAPIEDLSVTLTYSYLNNVIRTYDQVVGTGSLGFTTPAGTLPGQTPRVLAPGYNGPFITNGDALAVNDARSDLRSIADVWTLNARYEVLGHRLEYIGGFQQTKFTGTNSQDPGNTIIGYDPVQGISSRSYHRLSQEVRISSIPGDNILDYVLGFYYFGSKGQTDVYGTAAYLGGAFGPPGTTPSPFANPAAIERYRLPQELVIPGKVISYSFYASGTLHLPWDTELTAGIRQIHEERRGTTLIYLGPGLTGIPGGAGGACVAPGSVPSPIWGGACELRIARSLNNQFPSQSKRTPTIWNASLSHKFTPDILAYATVGTSFRAPGSNIGLLLANPDILTPAPERATSYEIGLKTTWFDNRLRLNGDVFQINYEGQLVQFPSIPYRNVVNGATSLTSTSFYTNLDSRVRGFEIELAAEPVQNFSISANAAYAKITSKGQPVPCNNPAVPLTPTNEMNFCPGIKGQELNTMPKFSATVNGEYLVPMERFDGYFRFNVAYRGKNPNYGFLASVPDYTLVDLFAGVRNSEGGWEAGLYAKNLFDKRVELTRTALTTNLVPANGSLNPVFGPAGYFAVTSNPPREVGLQLRYAFGSR